jgi:hypothetical protein
MLPIPDEQPSVEAYICSGQTEISEKIDKFMCVLTLNASKIGLHIKQEETWVGVDILAYGKKNIVQRSLYASRD